VAYVLRDNLPISTTQTLIRTRSGALHPVEYHCAPFARPHDQSVIVTWRDVAQQRRLEEELQRLASIPEESPNPIVELDACATLVYANSIMMELIGQFGFDEAAFPAILPSQVVNIVQECLHSGSSRAGFLVTCNGHSYEWTFFPVPHTALVRGYGVNLTERLRMENELRQAQRAAEAAAAPTTAPAVMPATAAPATISSAQSVTVTATSLADATKTATATKTASKTATKTATKKSASKTATTVAAI
jgi:hypothetical protein